MAQKISDDTLKSLYTHHHLTMEQIGKIAGVTRQAIFKRLKKLGVDTAEGELVRVKCSHCNREFVMHRHKWKRTRKKFCSKKCHHSHIHNPNFVSSRSGTRKARRIVAKYFDLKTEHRVHHKDGDEENNHIRNLAVFASQADHMAFHRGVYKPYIFDGASIKTVSDNICSVNNYVN